MDLFENFLQILAKELDLPQLKRDDNGACYLFFKEESIFVLFEYDDDPALPTILVSSALSSYPSLYQKEMCQLCLQANAIMAETFSIKPDEERIFIHRRIHPFIHPIDLKVFLKNFFSNCKTWKEAIEMRLKNPPSWY